MDPENVSLSFFTEVHRGNDYKEFKDLLLRYKQEFIQKDQQHCELLYLEKTREIFPVNPILDSNAQNQSGMTLIQRRFRPEFIQDLAENLNPDAFESAIDEEEDQKDIFLAG